ncbi:MAG: alpha/beta fold hydrolase [Janthinobacterium lividum]
MWEREVGSFSLGDFEVERGGVIKGAQIGWERHGTLNTARDNLIVYPSSYSAQHGDLAWSIGPDKILDPTRWCIVAIDMFSNGVSSGAAETADYPALVTMGDNVRAQHRLVTEQFGVSQVAAVYGFSMGGIQAYHWAARYPAMVGHAFVVCGSARTADHNQVFLSSLLATLEAAPEHLGNGRFSSEPKAALRAFGTIYAGWGLSQDFYRAGLYRTVLGAADLTSFVQEQWVDRFSARRAANLYAQALAWREADIADGGDLGAALGRIEAGVTLLPCTTDLYFRVADNAAELPFLHHGELRPIESIWGHRAGNPNVIPEDLAFLAKAVRDGLG